MASPPHLVAWRHPRPQAAEARCIGRTDIPLDRRRAKRLAHRIRCRARRSGWPRFIWTSPLARSADVGRWLANWGWCHRIDPRLAELDFGAWDGLPWALIGPDAVDRWCADFAHHAPGGGESLAALFERCAAFLADCRDAPPRLVVAHAGWINAALHLSRGEGPPTDAAAWPPAPRYGAATELRLTARGTLPSSGYESQ